MAQLVKNISALQETWVRSLDQEEPLEKEMATHSSILAWRIPWTEELGRLQSMGSQLTFTFSSVLYIVNPQVPVHPTTPSFPSWCSCVYSLYLCLYFCVCVGEGCWSVLSCAKSPWWHIGFLLHWLLLQGSGSLVEELGLSCSTACGILVPWLGINLGPLPWKTEP